MADRTSIRVDYGIEVDDDGKFVAFSQMDGEERRYSEPYETRREASAHNERSFEKLKKIVARHGARAIRRDVQ
jgi:hypothetical protein